MTASAPSSLSAATTFQLMFYFEDFSQSSQILIEGSIIHLSDQMILMFVWYLDFFLSITKQSQNCIISLFNSIVSVTILMKHKI